MAKVLPAALGSNCSGSVERGTLAGDAGPRVRTPPASSVMPFALSGSGSRVAARSPSADRSRQRAGTYRAPGSSGPRRRLHRSVAVGSRASPSAPQFVGAGRSQAKPPSASRSRCTVLTAGLRTGTPIPPGMKGTSVSAARTRQCHTGRCRCCRRPVAGRCRAGQSAADRSRVDGLLPASAWVSVGPPLICNGPSRGLTPEIVPGMLRKLQVAPLSRMIEERAFSSSSVPYSSRSRCSRAARCGTERWSEGRTHSVVEIPLRRWGSCSRSSHSSRSPAPAHWRSRHCRRRLPLNSRICSAWQAGSVKW